MAFNPFVSFRKYQRIWMAVILLLCMITFVLCTGTKGDFMEWVLSMARPRGTPWASIDGSKVYSSQFYALKEGRNIANDFMRKAGNLIVARMDEVLKPENIKKIEEKNPKEREEIFKVTQLRNELENQVRRPRYFGESSVKIDDLVDFKLWLAEADRLGIDFTPETVLEIAQVELGGRNWFNMDVFSGALAEVVRNHSSKATKAVLMQTLRDEFRVRAAQRVLGMSGGTRVALSPEQLWEFYKEKRVEYRLALLPIFVEDFVGKVGTPNETELSIFFDQYKTTAYDPASDKPGFTLPSRVKAAWISADPNSAFYKQSAKVALLLQTTPLPGPIMPGMQVIAGQLAKGDAARQYLSRVQRQYFSVSPAEAGADLAIADFLTRKDPFAAGALIGAGARLDAGIAVLPSHAAMGILRYAKQYQIGAQDELRKRAPIYASVALLGTAHHGLAVPGVWHHLRFKTESLPLSVVQDEVLEFIEREQAAEWVQKHMQLLKKKLEEPNVTTRKAIERVLDNYGQNIGLEQAETKDFWNKYNIQEAKELEPLRKSFQKYVTTINGIEGRNAAPATILKEDEFAKLFFDGSEAFSATGGRYQVKAWPPDVKVGTAQVQQARLIPQNQLDLEIRQRAEIQNPGEPVVFHLFEKAERPFLFWRTADEPPLVPEKIDQVRDQVIAAWKFNKARETVVLPLAKKIADAVEKSPVPNLVLNQQLEELKKKFQVKREIIPLSQVSPLVPISSGGMGGQVQRTYREFELPPDLVTYPRKDMAADLLGLYDLKKPLEIGYPELDKINKVLFDEISKEKKPEGKYVQILTNQPRTAFYLAVVRDPPFTSHFDFNQTVREAFGHDQFFERGQNEAAKRMREDLIQQLRKAHKVDPPSDETRKSFDSDAAS